MKVLVTGAAGFLGGHLVEMLRTRGDEVRALVCPGENVERLWALDDVEVVEGDVREISTLARAMQGVQRVYHLAARTSSWGKEEEYYAVNVDGLANVIFAALSAGVARIVHTSSVTVDGQRLRGLATDDASFIAEDNPYSRSKVIGEKLIANLIRDCQAPVVIVRPGWIYGARDVAGFARLAALIERGRGYIVGSGNNLLPLVHVRDVVQALIKAGDADEYTIGRTYTIVSDQHVTQEEYLHAIADALGVARVRCRLPGVPLYAVACATERLQRILRYRHTFPPLFTSYNITLLGGNYQLSSDCARQELGYEPEVNLQRGVLESVQWYRACGYSKDKRQQKSSLSAVEAVERMAPKSKTEQNRGESQKEACR